MYKKNNCYTSYTLQAWIFCDYKIAGLWNSSQRAVTLLFVVQGGAFFFLEHVQGDPSTWIYFFQHVLQPFMYETQTQTRTLFYTVV